MMMMTSRTINEESEFSLIIRFYPFAIFIALMTNFFHFYISLFSFFFFFLRINDEISLDRPW